MQMSVEQAEKTALEILVSSKGPAAQLFWEMAQQNCLVPDKFDFTSEAPCDWIFLPLDPTLAGHAGKIGFQRTQNRELAVFGLWLDDERSGLPVLMVSSGLSRIDGARGTLMEISFSGRPISHQESPSFWKFLPVVMKKMSLIARQYAAAENRAIRQNPRAA